MKGRDENGEAHTEAVPIALYTVARDLGHSSTNLIARRYGHLLENRKYRGQHVEFRPETYEEEIGGQIHELQVGA